MPDSDQLTAIGQKLIAALTSAYANADPNAALVFLPGGVTVPNDLVQAGIVNPAQMQTFLEINFDSPFVMSPSECAVHGRDSSHGTSSQIYMFAATSAQPLGSPTDDSWKRITAEIAMAQRNLGPSNMAGGFVCEPDDWVLPSNTSYWTVFDSTQTQPAPPNTIPTNTPAKPLPVPVMNPRLWALRTNPVPDIQRPVEMLQHPAPQRISMVSAASVSPAVTRPLLVEALPLERTVRQITPFPAAELMVRATIARPINLSAGATVQQVTATPASTITVQLKHQCVTLGYMSGGVSWWNSTFLADTGWFIPGMPRGGLLPLPQADGNDTDLTYGIPVSLIVVQGLTVSGNWSDEAAAALKAPGSSLGPFSLKGATATPGSNGTVTYSRPGMQVIALLCSQLPVLPPVDTPVAAPPPAVVTTTPPADTTTPQTESTSTSNSSANATTPPAAQPAVATSPPSSTPQQPA